MNKYDTEVLLTLTASPDATTLLNLLARLDAAEAKVEHLAKREVELCEALDQARQDILSLESEVAVSEAGAGSLLMNINELGALLDQSRKAARDATNRADVLQRDLNTASETVARLHDANAKLGVLAHRLNDVLLAAGLKYEGLRSMLGVLSEG